MSRVSTKLSDTDSRSVPRQGTDMIIEGLGNPSPYLLTDERVVVAVRRHIMVLAAAFAETLGFIAAAIMIHLLFPYTPAVDTIAGLICLAALVRFGYLILEWRLERFVITDQRMMLVGGVLTRQVAVMPMRKVTDLTFEKPLVGQIFGYGTFIVESAGQDQALSRIEYLPHANRLYLKVSDLLFGSHPPHDESDLPAPSAARDHYDQPDVAPMYPQPGYAQPAAPAIDEPAPLEADLQHTDPHLGSKLAGLGVQPWDAVDPAGLHADRSPSDLVYQPWPQSTYPAQDDVTEAPDATNLFGAVSEPRSAGERMRARLGGLNGRGRRRDEPPTSSDGPIRQRAPR